MVSCAHAVRRSAGLRSSDPPVVLLLVFGAKRLPEMGRSLGKGMREFKDAVSGIERRHAVCTLVADVAARSASSRPLPRSRAAPKVEADADETSGKPSPRSPADGSPVAPAPPLDHGEEATLVEHLDELRSRLIICLIAIVPAFALTFAFHDQIMEWLTGPLPDGKKLVTLGVTEPFTTSVKVSLIAAVAVDPSRPALAVLGVLRARVRAALRSASSSCSSPRDRPLRLRRALHVLRRPPTRARVPDVVRRRALRHPDPGELLLHLRRADAARGGLAFLMPIFVLGARAPPRPLVGHAAPEPPDRVRPAARRSPILLPTVDPISLAFEVVPLLLLFELSIWLCVLMERRWQRGWDEELAEAGHAVRVISADWVVPVEGPPIADGAVAIATDGRIAAVGTRRRARRGRALPRGGDPPGLRQRAQPPRVRRLRGLRGRARLPGRGSACTSSASSASTSTTWGDRPARRTRVPPLGDHDRRRLQLQRRGGDRLRRARARGRSCTSRSSDATAAAPGALRADAATAIADALSRARAARDLAARAVHLLGRALPRLRRARAPARDPPRGERRRDRVPADRTRARGRRSPRCSCRRSGTTGIRALAEAGCSGPHVLAAHCVQADDEEIELLAEHDVAVAHCPRSNALLGCGVAPLAALREAGIRVCIATDSPASTPSFDMFDEMRAAIVARAGARAPARRAHRRRRARARDARRALARSGLEAEIGSLVPGKQADLTILSLAGTPFVPWEDPVTAAVLGGSPERVLATLVSGETAI